MVKHRESLKQNRPPELEKVMGNINALADGGQTCEIQEVLSITGNVYYVAGRFRLCKSDDVTKVRTLVISSE